MLLQQKQEKNFLKVEEFVVSGVSAENFLTALLSKLHLELLAKSAIGEESFPKLSENDLIVLIELLWMQKGIFPTLQLKSCHLKSL